MKLFFKIDLDMMSFLFFIFTETGLKRENAECKRICIKTIFRNPELEGGKWKFVTKEPRVRNFLKL